MSCFRREVDEICYLLGYYAAFIITDVSGQPLVPIFKGQETTDDSGQPVGSILKVENPQTFRGQPVGSETSASSVISQVSETR
jgi:hypothetical protein